VTSAARFPTAQFVRQSGNLISRDTKPRVYLGHCPVGLLEISDIDDVSGAGATPSAGDCLSVYYNNLLLLIVLRLLAQFRSNPDLLNTRQVR
jgi:hypothetical protein